MSNENNPTRALFSEDGETWKNDKGNPSVSKVVVGTPWRLGDEAKPLTIQSDSKVWEGIVKHWKSITHLYLWQVENVDALLEAIGCELPSGLKCLDLRKCDGIEELPSLPQHIEELVIWNCSGLNLKRARDDGDFSQLVDLSLRDVAHIHDSWLSRVLREAPLTRLLEIENCESIEYIEGSWPEGLVDIRLNKNKNLSVLPEGWPSQLRRLELSQSKIESLHPLPKTADYLNFTGMRKLTQLPSGWEQARTMFLYRSGLLEPPVSEQGDREDQNVAADTKEYFNERQLVGDGNVRRCKVLVLGNGSAGKTCFSHGLVGKDTRGTESTEGIQFLQHQIHAPVKMGQQSSIVNVPLHIWDFGGQEIYHDVHRLFMEAGSVFVVLWNPEQDGKECPSTAGPFTELAYEDRWRPLKYWFDLIHAACPHDPKILVVCSRRKQTDESLQRRLAVQLQDTDYFKHCELVCIDSCPDEDREQTGAVLPKGELDERDRWLKRSVGDVLSTQGTVVSSYWEIAQEMVEGWLKRLRSGKGEDLQFAKDFRQISMETFEAELTEALQNNVDKFPKLKNALLNNDFQLSGKRIQRTLRFLTRTGWVYWNEELKEQRVIVGQQWALDGIYALLRREAQFYNELRSMEARFDDTYFKTSVLAGGDYSIEEKELLLSFMLKFGYLIKIQDTEATWWARENEYLSVMHLDDVPTRVTRHYDSAPEALSEYKQQVTSKGFHRANWCGILSKLGETYGKKAHYYKNAFVLDREAGEDIFIFVSYDASGLGADLTVGVRGQNATEELMGLTAWLKEWFPEHRAARSADLPATPAKDMDVFLSYTWDEQTKDAPVRYEEPVNAIDDMLKEMDGVHPVRDRRMKQGESITEFMEKAAKNCELFIMIHSDKYWMSPNCMYEVICLNNSFREHRRETYQEVLLGVEHIPDDAQVDNVFRVYGLSKTPPEGKVGPIAYLQEFWRKTPPPLGAKYDKAITPEKLADEAVPIIPTYLKCLDEALEVNHKWRYGADKVLEKIKDRVRAKLLEFREKLEKENRES